MKLYLLTAALFLTTLLTPSSSSAQQYIYVANAGDDTVSKIDINTNQEVARYATWFTSGVNHIPHSGNSQTGPAPSRLIYAGNLYVLNRFFSPAHLPVLLKIAPTGGIPGTTTSNGPTVLPLLDNNANNQIDPGEAADVRIQWAKPIGNSTDVGALGRALCMDTNGVLWVGMHNTQRYYKVDPATGNMLAPLTGIPTPGHKPYGCQVDTKGRLWSVDSSNTLAEIDTVTNQVTIRNHATFGANYSLSLFNGCGSTPSKVYISERSLAKTYTAYDPQTLSFNNAPATIPQFVSVAVAVDRKGNIVSGQYQITGHVMKTTPSGTLVWHTNTAPAGPVIPSADLHGIIIDENDDVWAVHRTEDRIVKYSGVDGHWIATVPVGSRPYTYGNPPPPTCPCAEIFEQSITCEAQSNGIGTYAWSFLFTNHSPFLTPATAIDISSSQVTNLTPTPQFLFTNPVPPNGQATVSGTFTVANPVFGSQVCLDIRLNGGGGGWCCPRERVCFRLPECPGCANVQAVFKCKNGIQILQLTVVNQGPTTAQSVTVFSNTPGVIISPQTTTQTFPQNTPVTISLAVTGASLGQPISLTVNLNGPFDPKTGINTWCCTSTVKVFYPKLACAQELEGWIFNDLDVDGLRDSSEDGLSGVTVTLTDGQGTPRTTLSDESGIYRFDNVEPGTYRVSVQTPRGRRLTVPEGGVYTVTVGGPPERTFDFGVAKTQP
jgi:streptogramin lyase